ncbi:MAG: hypothetical protein GZ091_10355 [Paludibacter sp.]|nr:hypothetical protein [Paludibacter sp.]
MNHADFITLVKQPEKLNSTHVSELSEITELYPAFVQARVLYVKTLQQSHNIHFAANLKLAALYSTNRRWLYYFMHPKKKLTLEPYFKENSRKSHGDYFDMIEAIERDGGDAKQSLKNLAERLKTARVIVTTSPLLDMTVTKINEINTVNSTDKPNFNFEDFEIVENIAKNLIREKKYIEAIEILRKLNLNNPKKSVYFADQIRFLEKVIVNSKK